MTKTWNTIEKKEFDLTASRMVIVSKVENNNGEVIDIRNFYEDDDRTWKPTQKGISLPIKDELYPAKTILLEALKMAGVTRDQILEYYDFEDVMGSQEDDR